MKPRIIVTGNPGVGKTTCILKVLKILISEDVKVGGFYSQEVRVKGRRVGFEVCSTDGNRGWLAKADDGLGGHRSRELNKRPSGHIVGRYRVIEEDFDRVGLTSLKKALSDPSTQVILVDEVGPMELASRKFEDIIYNVLGQNKVFLVTVQRKLAQQLKSQAQKSGAVAFFNLTFDNRTEIPPKIVQLIREALTKIPKSKEV